MTPENQKAFREVVDSFTGAENVNESEIKKALEGVSSSRPYSVGGPHGRVRQLLAWVNKLLAYDLNESASAISVRELREALLAFQKDVRVQALGPILTQADSTGGGTPSQSGASRRATARGNTVRAKTRNFKN